MATHDRIRLTGLLRKPLQMQGLLLGACITHVSPSGRTGGTENRRARLSLTRSIGGGGGRSPDDSGQSRCERTPGSATREPHPLTADRLAELASAPFPRPLAPPFLRHDAQVREAPPGARWSALPAHWGGSAGCVLDHDRRLELGMVGESVPARVAVPHEGEAALNARA